MQATHDQLKPVTFQVGDILFREGEQSYHFYIIQEGSVRIFRETEDGRRIELAVVSEGSSIGEFAMIDRLPRSASAEAITEVKAVEVSESAYETLLSELPDWTVAVLKALVERLRHANDIIRKAQSIDPTLKDQITSAEFDPDSSKVRSLNLDDDDVPDLA